MALTRTFINRLDEYVTLRAQRPSGAQSEPPKRLVRSVLLAFGIALCSAAPAGMAMPLPKLTPYQYAHFQVGKTQTKCLFNIATKESNIRYNAINKSSGASGAWQFMNNKVRHLTPNEQVEWAIRYANHRYGSSCNAWKFWQRNNWW